MLRNLNATLPGGGRILGTPFVGLLAAQILADTSTGPNGPGAMFNDGLIDGHRYRMLLASPSTFNGTVREDGSIGPATAPTSGSYTLYEDNLLVGSSVPITVGTIIAMPPSNSTIPVVSGTATQGQILSSTAGTWLNSPSSYAYRWFRGVSVIAGEVGSTYTLALADVGSTIRVGVIATNGDGSSTEAYSAFTAAVAAQAVAPEPVGTAFTDWLDRVLPYVPGCPEDTALLHIVDAAKEFCRRTLAYNYQHEAIPTVAGQGSYLLVLPTGVRLAKVMGCQIGDGTSYAVQGGSLGRSLQRNMGGNVCLLEDPRTIVLSPAPTQSGLPIVVDIAVMPTDAGTAVWPDSLEDHIEYIAAGAIGSLCAMPEKAAGWRDLQSSIDNRAKFNARIAALKVQLSRSEVWSARAKTVWF